MAPKRKRVKLLRGMIDTCTFSVRNGRLHMYPNEYTSDMGAMRAEGQYDLIKDVARFIPDFDAVLSIHECVLSP